MPTNPLRKRAPVKKGAKTARNIALADTVYVFVRDRIVARVPRVKPKRRVVTKPKALAAGAIAAGAAVGAAALARAKRSKDAAEPPPPPAAP